MATHSISIDELARDLPKVLARVRAGESIRVEDGAEPAIIIQATTRPDRARRTIDETLSLMEDQARTLGYTPSMGHEFAADVEERIQRRKPLHTSAWD